MRAHARYVVGMTKAPKQLTAEEQALLDEGWEEMGESIAMAVVDGGKNLLWAWKLLGPLGLYKRWMLSRWVDRYKEEHPKPKRKRKRATVKSKKKVKSIFTKQDQINCALQLLNEGKSPLECLEEYSKRN